MPDLLADGEEQVDVDCRAATHRSDRVAGGEQGSHATLVVEMSCDDMPGCRPLGTRDMRDEVTDANPECSDVGSVVPECIKADLDQVPAMRQFIHGVTERVS
jgi:hypothetical protein